MVIVRFADDFVVGFEHRQEASDSSRNSANDSRSLAWNCIPTRHGSSNWPPCGQESTRPRRRETGELQLSGLHAHQRENPKRLVHGAAADDAPRWQAKVQAVRIELKRRLHDPVPEVGAYLRSVVTGTTATTGCP